MQVAKRQAAWSIRLADRLPRPCYTLIFGFLSPEELFTICRLVCRTWQTVRAAWVHLESYSRLHFEASLSSAQMSSLQSLSLNESVLMYFWKNQGLLAPSEMFATIRKLHLDLGYCFGSDLFPMFFWRLFSGLEILAVEMDIRFGPYFTAVFPPDHKLRQFTLRHMDLRACRNLFQGRKLEKVELVNCQFDTSIVKTICGNSNLKSFSWRDSVVSRSHVEILIAESQGRNKQWQELDLSSCASKITDLDLTQGFQTKNFQAVLCSCQGLTALVTNLNRDVLRHLNLMNLDENYVVWDCLREFPFLETLALRFTNRDSDPAFSYRLKSQQHVLSTLEGATLLQKLDLTYVPELTADDICTLWCKLPALRKVVAIPKTLVLNEQQKERVVTSRRL